MIDLAHFTKYSSTPATARFVHFFRGIKQHRTSFLIGTDGVIEQLYQDFKTSNHHEVVLQSLN